MPSSRRSSRRPYGKPTRPLDVDRATGGRRMELRHGEDWVVQRVRSGAKDYICPGCQQLVATGTAHVVAWPADSILGPDAALASRRHWHSSCWDRG